MANYSSIRGSGSGGGGGGVTAYANYASFPSSGNTEGDLAFAQDTDALYVWDGAAWDRVDSGGESPVILTDPPTSTQSLSSSGSTSTVTMVAQDPEGFDIVYGIAYKTASNARPTQLGADTTINQSTGTYTFTPSTNGADGGSFKARLSASDGANTTTRFVDFRLDFSTLTVSPSINGNTTFTSGSVTGFAPNTVYTLSNNTGADFDFDLDLEGGSGGGRSSDGAGGGAGGLTTGRYTLAANSSINLLVGAKGNNGTDSRYGGNGGEGTGIYTGTYGSGEVPIMVAGGGGGSMNGGTQTGGGGGTTGGAGSDTSSNSNDTPAGGGTQSAAGGGAGGNRYNGNSGSGRNGGAAPAGANMGGYTNPNPANSGPGFGNGGVGCFYPSGGGAGGGGGGYYGGGGGAIVFPDAGSGGAGGSGYFNPNVVTNGSTTTSGGTLNSNGSCTITFV
tara:strand:- start:1648 stop:2988 length:1341 start_codon:yes stop_codon:yes gene_type:complete